MSWKETIQTQSNIEQLVFPSSNNDFIDIKIFGTINPDQIWWFEIVSETLGIHFSLTEKNVEIFYILQDLCKSTVTYLQSCIASYFEGDKEDYQFYLDQICHTLNHLRRIAIIEDKNLEEAKQSLYDQHTSIEEAQMLSVAFKVQKLSLKSSKMDIGKDLDDFLLEMNTTTIFIKEALVEKNHPRVQKKLFRLIKLTQIAQVVCLLYQNFLMTTFANFQRYKFANIPTVQDQVQHALNELKFPFFEAIFKPFQIHKQNVKQ